MSRHRIGVACLLLITHDPSLISAANAADPTYWADVRPILRKNCTVCHSERRLDEPEISAGLALDRLELIRAGGKGGRVPVLVPGKPDDSLLVTLLTSPDKKRAMPLDADPLSPEDIATIRKWVAAGAPEGVRPAAADAAVVAARPARVRRLDVTLATRATFPKSLGLPGTVEVTLPVGPLPPVAAVAFSPDGRWLASGSYGRVTVWDLATAKPVTFLTNLLGAVNDLRFSPDGKLLAVAGGQPSARGDLRLFETSHWKLVHSLGGHLDTVSAVAFSPDGSKLASVSFDRTVRLWGVKDGSILHTFTGHSDFVYSVAFGPDGSWFVTVGKDRTGRIIDTATGQGRFTLGGSDQEVLAVAVHPDGRVVTSGTDPGLNWWDPKTAERTRRTAGPAQASNELAFDARGTVLAVGGADGTVRFYEPKTGTAQKAVTVGNPVFAVALDPSGKRAASGGADGLVRLWDVADARLLATLWSGAGDDWLSLTPEGYTAGAETTLAKAVWKAGGKPVTDAKLLAPFRDAAQVGKAASGGKVPEPVWK